MERSTIRCGKPRRVISDFRQREPVETASATEKTEVRILYDARHVYIGIHCYDQSPSAIVSTQLRRDLTMDLDDNFAVMIDPTLSHRNGYIFEVNPLGTQRDGQVIEEQAPGVGDSIVDPSWDGLWISAAKITTDGWTATIAIPFSTLNFKGGAEVDLGSEFPSLHPSQERRGHLVRLQKDLRFLARLTSRRASWT